jgi:hypothetical protein
LVLRFVAALKGKLIQLDREIDEYCKEHEEDEFEAWKREQDAKLEQYKTARRLVSSRRYSYSPVGHGNN